MLRNRQWEMAATMPVATLARLTVPETAAGLRPAPSKMLELVGPKPIPSAPSTSEAQKPARATSKSTSIDNFSYRLIEMLQLSHPVCRAASGEPEVPTHPF